MLATTAGKLIDGKGDDFQIISGDEYVITPEGDVILKETGDLL